MPRVTIILDMTDEAYGVIADTLTDAIDNDTSVGLRIKPEIMAEHTLAPEVWATVYAVGDEGTGVY